MAIEVASASDCPTVTPFAIADMPSEVASRSVANAMAQVTAASPSGTDGAQPAADVSQPNSSVALTQRIFIPRNDGVSLTRPSDGPTTSTWVQLVLGFGLIGVPRVTYRRNGKS